MHTLKTPLLGLATLLLALPLAAAPADGARCASPTAATATPLALDGDASPAVAGSETPADQPSVDGAPEGALWTTSCTTDCDCGGVEYVCNDGTCSPDFSPLPECRCDSHCSGGQVCDDYQCVECANDSHCGWGEFCVDNNCVECRSNADCPNGYTCIQYNGNAWCEDLFS